MILDELFPYNSPSDHISTLRYIMHNIGVLYDYPILYHRVRGKLTELEVATEFLNHCYDLPSRYSVYNNGFKPLDDFLVGQSTSLGYGKSDYTPEPEDYVTRLVKIMREYYSTVDDLKVNLRSEDKPEWVQRESDIVKPDEEITPMTPLNPAPRHLAVQDKSIDLSVNTALISVERPRYPYDTFKVWLQHQGHMFCVYEGSTDVELECREWNDKIHKALHPPLCMKHALEIGYEFRDESIYSVKVRGSAKPQYLYGHEITSEVVCTVDMVDWFQPDAHGEAEAVVNAWKEGE